MRPTSSPTRPRARSPRSRWIIANCWATRWRSSRREKAGILKRGVPVAIGAQPAEVADVLLAAAARIGAPVRLRDRDWRIENRSAGFRYRTRRVLDLPPPSLPGAFQLDNAGIAIAALRASALAVAGPGDRARHCRGGMAGAAAAPARTACGAVAGRLGALARRRAQSRRRRRAGRASAVLGGSAGASGRRDEAGEGRRRIPAAVGFVCNHRLGGGGAGAARRDVRSRRSSARRAASRGRGRTWPTRCVHCRVVRALRAC